MTIIDIMNGKTMYFVASNKPDPCPPEWDPNARYTFFVKASEIGKAHQFARKHLGKGFSFSVRPSSGIEQVIPDAEIYDAD